MEKRAIYILTLLTLVWFGAIMVSSQYGVLNPDEPWYLTASHSVLLGRLPYRDFAYTQAPLLPYIYGALIWFLGANIAIGRFISVALALLAFALALNIARQLAGLWAVILAFILLAVTPGVLYFVSVVKTYSLATALTLLALALVLHKHSSPSANWPFWSTLAAGMASMVRISFLPVPILVFLFWLMRGRWKASGLGLLAVISVTLVFAANSGGNFLFDIFEFHQRVMAEPDTGLSDIKLTLFLATSIAFAPALYSVVYLLVLSMLFHSTRERLVGWFRAQPGERILLALITACLWIVHFAVPGNFWEYQVPGYFLACILLASLVSHITYAKNRVIPISIFIICAATSSVPEWVNWAHLVWQPTSLLTTAKQQSEALARASRQGDTLLGSFNHLGLAAGVDIFPDNEMGLFSVSGELPIPETKSRHLLSENAVTNALQGCLPTFVVTGFGFPFDRSVPSTAPIPKDIQHKWVELLDRNYSPVFGDSQVTIYRHLPEVCTSAISPNDY